MSNDAMSNDPPVPTDAVSTDATAADATAADDVSRTTESTSAAAPAPQFVLKRMLLLLVCAIGLMVIVGAGVMMWNTRTIPLTMATGRVLWNGKPVTVGAVMTQHESNPQLGTLSGLDKDGRFELLTNGEPGAAAGRHKVKVAAFSTGFPPVPVVPSDYTEFSTSGLAIDVTRDPKNNHFELELTGELPTSDRPESTEEVSTE